MADFYFVYNIIDIFWKIFSILFVLYRFTSFFSMLYEFFKFLGKLLKKLIYVKDQIVIYIRKRNNYSLEEHSFDLPIRQESFFTKLYNKLFKKNNHTYLPLYETRTECTNNYDDSCSDSQLKSDIFHFNNRDSIQSETFNKLLNSNISIQSSSDVFNSNQDYNTSIQSSIYPPTTKHEQIQPESTLFNLLKSKLNERQEEHENLLEESDELDSLFKPNI